MGSYRGFTAEEERFHTSMIEREQRQRLHWFLKQADEEVLNELQADLQQEEKKLEVLKEVEKEQRTSVSAEKRAEEAKDEVVAAAMRPVPEQVRDLIYSGKESGGGRKNYLAQRKRLSPKEKYYFAECKSWEYGWNADKPIAGEESGQYGRTAVIHQSFYRRAGVFAHNPLHRPPINMDTPVIIPLS